METSRLNRLNVQKLLSIFMIITGFSLLIWMIVMEDEPGAIPLLMIAAGSGGYLFTRNKIKSLHK